MDKSITQNLNTDSWNKRSRLLLGTPFPRTYLKRRLKILRDIVNEGTKTKVLHPPYILQGVEL